MANSSPASHEDHPTALQSAPARPDSPGHPGGRADGSVAAGISNRIVGLLREHAGRGPTRAKTIVSSELVVVTLGDCFTIGERRLLAAGHAELVATTRAAIHDEMREEATAIVEELTDRHVSAYLTDQGHDPDLAVLVFFLARDPSGLQPRAPARETPGANNLLSIGVERYGEAWWLSVRGELDLSTAPILERELLDCEAQDDRPITIDLRALTFMDLAGLRLLLDASGRSRTNTNRLSLVRGPRAVQRVIELTRSEPLLSFTDPPEAR